jgi:glycosyltransferase involved in cell wall biosynthesis
MNIGFVTVWQNRGQAQVMRQVRGIYDEAGHSTFVLARPTASQEDAESVVPGGPPWDAPGITFAASHLLSHRDYGDWVDANSIEVVFCFMNRQISRIRRLRKRGVKTIGYFVWERAKPSLVEEAKDAYDVIYSLHRAEQDRYRRLGVESPYLRYGIHPELAAHRAPRKSDAVYLIYHGGWMGRRKPTRAVVDAFKRVSAPELRLVLKSQGSRHRREGAEIADDPRIIAVDEDMSFDSYLALFSSCHACLAPARWEGLGVHLFEALAYEMPVIATDIPPINEVVTHGESGLLVKGHPCGKAKSGITAFDPDMEELASAIAAIARPEVREGLEEGCRRRKLQLDWENTRRDYLDLLEGVVAG